jgi:hypothetical protein
LPVNHLGLNAGDFISIAWEMRVSEASGPSDTFGPYFGVEAYDDSVAIKLLGSLGVDASTGDVLFQAAGSGFLTETGHVVDFGAWHSYELRLDYGADTYSYFFDGVQIGTEAFVDGPSSAFTDADIATFAAAGDPASLALTGTAHFDNFLVVEGVIGPTLPGDYNSDNTVDAADYVVWRKNYGTTNMLPNDPNDGTIDDNQYVTWRENFGQSGSGAGANSPALATPEPACCLMLGTFVIVAAFIRHERTTTAGR